MRNFITLSDLSTLDLQHLLAEAARLKSDWRAGERPAFLPRRVLGLVFEKPSLRTRVSFEAAMQQLGGTTIFLSATDGPIGQRESVADFARTMTQYVDAVVLRVYRHATIDEFARHSRVPVINGLSDLGHPCQALGDLLTIQEVFGDVRGRTVAFIGDGNNVARSLAVGCGLLGAHFVLAAPEGYRFDDAFLKEVRKLVPDADVSMNGKPDRAVSKADVIYTDVWTSMGQESEQAVRKKKFAPYQVNEKLLAKAPDHAKVMHCLPAHRGEEVSDTILDGPQSVVFEQAANRMHVQKAVLKWLLG